MASRFNDIYPIHYDKRLKNRLAKFIATSTNRVDHYPIKWSNEVLKKGGREYVAGVCLRCNAWVMVYTKGSHQSIGTMNEVKCRC